MKTQSDLRHEAGSRSPAPRKLVGILALQGDFADHRRHFLSLGCRVVLIRRAEDFEGLSALVIPGGESSTMIYLLRKKGLWDPLARALDAEMPAFGTCAGAILLAKAVLPTPQHSFAAMDTKVLRNAYGRQRESFETALDIPVLGSAPLTAYFIRAPRIVECGRGIEVLGRLDGDPVLVRQKNRVASSFHSELSHDTRLHRYFLETCC